MKFPATIQSRRPAMAPVGRLGCQGNVMVAMGGGLFLGAASLLAQDYDLSWTTTDGGGGASENGFFAIEATVGQPDAGVMSDGFYQIESGFWPAALETPPFASIDPRSVTVDFGDSLTLTASPAGTGPYRYQWRLNGVNLAGQTNATLSLNNIQLANLGAYSIVVVNSEGIVESEPSVVTANMRDLKPGDDFVDRAAISPALPQFMGQNVGFTLERDEPLHAGKLGGASGWYSWMAPSNGIATFRTTGGAFDTLLGVYTGKSVDELQSMAGDDDRGGFLTSEVRFNAKAGEDYSIAVDGLGGRTGVFTVTWELEVTSETLPVITSPPFSRAVPRGGSTLFTVAATGSGLSYQWFFNGLAIAGEMSSSLMVANVQSGEVGQYSVRVTNADGRTVESLPAALEIGPVSTAVTYHKLEDLFLALGLVGGGAPLTSLQGAAAGLSGDAGAMPVSVGTIQQQEFENVNALNDEPCDTPCGEVGGAAQWMAIAPEMDGILHLDTLQSEFDTVVYAFEAALDICDGFAACDSDGGGDGVTSSVSFPVQGGRTYIVVVDGENGEQGTAILNVQLCQSSPPFVRNEDGFFLTIPPEPAPYPPDDPVYTWLRDGVWYAETADPVLFLDEPPFAAAHFTVYYDAFEDGEFNVVTNDLGAILVAQFALDTSEGEPTFQMMLPGVFEQPFQVERADTTRFDCDQSWVWLPETDYIILPSEKSTILSFPAHQAGRFYRVRPLPAQDDSP